MPIRDCFQAKKHNYVTIKVKRTIVFLGANTSQGAIHSLANFPVFSLDTTLMWEAKLPKPKLLQEFHSKYVELKNALLNLLWSILNTDFQEVAESVFLHTYDDTLLLYPAKLFEQ